MLKNQFEALYDQICLESYGQQYTESPLRVSPDAENWLDNYRTNGLLTVQLHQTHVNMGPIKFGDSSIELFREVEDRDVSDLFGNKTYTKAQFLYKLLPKNGIEFVRARTDRTDKGYGLLLIFEYYLNVFDYIISGDSHTPLGEKYWLGIIKNALLKSYRVSVLDMYTQTHDNYKELAIITNPNQVEQYYKQHNTLFKIEK